MTIFKSKPDILPHMSLRNTADDLYANKNSFYIDIFHVPSGESVQFKAFVTQFDDQYQSDFGSEEVFGRMDTIQVYKGTKRQIGLSWDVPSASEFEAVQNMKKCSKLMNMLYPVYKKTKGSGKVLNAPPVFKIKFANLIRDAGGASYGSGGTASTSGLFGTIAGFSYSPDMDSGYLEVPVDDNGNIGAPGVHDISLIPQTISLQCQFTVVHTHDLGYEESDTGSNVKQINQNFPFGIPTPESPSVNSASPTNSDTIGAEVSTSNDNQLTGQIMGEPSNDK